jgi:hypothetical protein
LVLVIKFDQIAKNVEVVLKVLLQLHL